MTIPTTPLKFPMQGKPLTADGNWTQAWYAAFQYLFSRVGSDVAPSNQDLADAIALNVTGPATASNNDVVIFNGTTGKIVKDSGVLIGSLAPLNSPAFTGAPTVPTAIAGTNSTQIASTAFVNTAFAGFGAVIGPVSATNNAIALYNGTTGKIIKDSAVLLTSLAPLASPALTGTPVAPTATTGTNTTQLATTAFVQSTLSASVSNFSAHNNGTNQAIATSTFTTVTLGTTIFNNGANFAANAWTPPAGRPVLLTGAVQMVISGTGSVLVSIFKNGSEFKRGEQQSFSGIGIVGVSATVSMIDIPNGTDVYTLSVFQSFGASQNTTGTSTLTWFQGTTLRP